MDEQDRRAQHPEDIEMINNAEEWLVRARRVGRMIERRVKSAIDLGGPPVLRAPHVRLDGEPTAGAEPGTTG